MIINTRADLDALAVTDPAARAAFIANLKGSMTVMADTQTYPVGYDHNLQPGDAGYIAPVIGPVNDDSTAARFGYTREELLAM